MKKKFAVCFSGYPRFVEKTFFSIKNNLLDGLESYDVFAHFQWVKNWNQTRMHHGFEDTFQVNELEDFKKLYSSLNLKKLNVIDPYKFEVSNYNKLSLYPGMYLTLEQSRDQLYRSKCQYQGILDCINLVDNKEDYEYYIRIRTDLIFQKKLNLSNFNSNVIVNQNGYIAGADRKNSDWFFICPNYQLNFFDNMSKVESHYKDGIVAMHLLIEELGKSYRMQTEEFYIKLGFEFYNKHL
jgi:hypothetical protein